MRLPHNLTLLIVTVSSLVFVSSCENRDLNEGEAFKPREIHENIIFNFDKITVDGIEYLILEKDNNNPHEGFGFMAFRANKMMEKQDTILAYLKTIRDLQVRNYAAISRRNLDDVVRESDELLLYHLEEEQADFDRLESSELRSTREVNAAQENGEPETTE
ncbi:MAG: hypothetical protein JXR10_01295 [Cyclobacteriaceae bacterium]